MNDFRAGFVCFVGRPNTGKSTLTNALIGAKIAITSGKPQTTRRAIRGIVHRENYQLIVVDTPGLHRPRTLLGARLNDVVVDTLYGVDVIALCLPANEAIGPGDRYIAEQLTEVSGRTPVVAVVTKTDTVSSAGVAEALLAANELGDWDAVVPVSAHGGYQVDRVEEVLSTYMPQSVPLYPEGHITDEPEDVRIAELVREVALGDLHEELPHSLAVQVEEIVPAEDASTPANVFVNLYVERPSQKAIIIGRKGTRLGRIGARAKRPVEAVLGYRIHLHLHVKVAKDWQRDPKQLGRLGFEF